MSRPLPVYPLRVSADGTHFTDAEGTPALWLGDTSWPLLTQYPTDRATAYIERRAAQGFTVIQTVLAWVEDGSNGDDTPRLVPTPRGHVIWDETPAEPDPRVLDYVVELAAHAERHGVALAMIGMWGWFVVENPVFDVATARAYGRALGARFADVPNLIWMNGGDRVPTGYEDVWEAYARGVREGGSRHLMTFHPTGVHSSSYWFHDAHWLDFDFIQSWGSWTRLHALVTADRLAVPPKPTVAGEPAYEDGPEYPTGPITPRVVRAQAWWTVLAGGSFTYGHNDAWRMGPDWFDLLDAPGAAQLTVLRDVLEQLPWWELHPDQSVLADPSSGRSLRAAARTADRSRWLIYTPEPGLFGVCIDRVAAATARATWIDPRTGERVDAGLHDTQNERGIVYPYFEDVRAFRTPRFFDDALLLIEAVPAGEANPTAPGRPD